MGVNNERSGEGLHLHRGVGEEGRTEEETVVLCVST